MITVTLYQKPGCPECEQAQAELEALQESLPHQLVSIDVSANPDLDREMGARVPIVEVGPYKLYPPFSRQDLQVAIGAAQDRYNHLEKVGDTHFQERLARGHSVSGSDRFTTWLSNHYVALFNLILFIYVGLPFLAPVLMKVGATAPAQVIYKIYSPLCHQWAFRSWFLFGEQPAYPRQIAEVKGLASYEAVTGLSSLDTTAARAMLGNPTMGYKVALCERDVAIYGALLLFGLIFGASGRRLPSLPWYFWLLLGITPIAVDGFSQIPSLLSIPFLTWLPIRESTPLLRTLTGGLFGFTTAWYGYPIVETSMRETRMLMARKIAIANRDLPKT